MPLFGRLHEDTFLLFSGSNRHLYACVISSLYREFFGGSSFASPFRQDVLLHIAETVRGNAALWADEETLAELPPPARRLGRHRIRRQAAGGQANDPIGQRSNHVYARMLATGWLVEEPFGFNTQVEMPPAAMALAEQLVAIEAGLSQLFAGVVAEIRTAVRAIHDGEERSLLALPRAAESATGFVRRLRAIHASLRDVERSLMTSGDLEDRLRHFIDEFVERVVIVDFRAVLTSDHPYHHRHEILRTVDDLRHHEERRQDLARKYVQASIAPDEAEAWLAVEGHLSDIESTFASVDDFMGRLNAFRARLEERLRNTVRYMERADDSFSSEVADLIRRLDAIAERREAAGLPLADWPCALPRHDRPWSAELAAQPRAARTPVAPQRIAPVSRDPAEDVYRSLARRFARLFAPRSDAELAAFLERCVPAGSAIEARSIRLETLEDFLLFDELRRRRHAGPALLDGRFLVAEAPGLHSSAWIECPNFALRRGPDRQRPAPAAAGGAAP